MSYIYDKSLHIEAEKQTINHSDRYHQQNMIPTRTEDSLAQYSGSGYVSGYGYACVPQPYMWTSSTPYILPGHQSTVSHRQGTEYDYYERHENSEQESRSKKRRNPTVAQRRAANVRERRRMYNLNEAFDLLRKRVPTFAYEKRLSRIETLRLAITYISFMTDILNGGNPEDVRFRVHKNHTGYDVSQRQPATDYQDSTGESIVEDSSSQLQETLSEYESYGDD